MCIDADTSALRVLANGLHMGRRQKNSLDIKEQTYKNTTFAFLLFFFTEKYYIKKKYPFIIISKAGTQASKKNLGLDFTAIMRFSGNMAKGELGVVVYSSSTARLLFSFAVPTVELKIINHSELPFQ